MCSFTNNLLTPLYSEESISQELVLQAMNLGLSHYKGEEEERRRKEKTEAGKAEAVQTPLAVALCLVFISLSKSSFIPTCSLTLGSHRISRGRH
jgi:hypothetical protein